MDSVFQNNQSLLAQGGGLTVRGEATILTTRFSANEAPQGGGLANRGTTTLVDSVVDGNMGTRGAGIVSSQALTLVNSTVSSNAALEDGGGVWNDGGTTTWHNVTLTANVADVDDNGSGEGGGIFTTGTTTLWNSIVAGNDDYSAATAHPDCSGTLTSQGFNLIQSLDGCMITGDTTGNITGVSPALGPLQDNGGPTPTHALPLRSPAIDAANPTGCVDDGGMPLAADQRGYPRPVDGGSGSARCDMGAFEFDALSRLYLPLLHSAPGRQ